MLLHFSKSRCITAAMKLTFKVSDHSIICLRFTDLIFKSLIETFDTLFMKAFVPSDHFEAYLLSNVALKAGICNNLNHCWLLMWLPVVLSVGLFFFFLFKEVGYSLTQSPKDGFYHFLVILYFSIIKLI